VNRTMKRAGLLVTAALAACCPTPKRAATSVATAMPVDPASGDPTPTTPTPPAVVLDWNRAGIDWSRPPAPLPETAFVAPVPTRFTLANGAKVLLVENHRLPLVSVRIAIGTGGSRSDGKLPGLAAFVADLLDEGAGSRDATQLPEELERLGADLSVNAQADHAQVSLDTMAETLEPALAIAADVIVRPRLEAADFERVKAERLADLALRADQPRQIAALVFERVLYGSHPYAPPGAGYPASVTKIELADAKAFWKQSYGPAATTIVIAGDVTEAEARRILDAQFGGWKTKVKVPTAPKAPVVGKPSLAFVDRPGAPQSVVVFGRLGPSASDPDRAANDVVNTAVGGSFASRLNAVLREEKGYTYGISSNFWRGQWSGVWSATSSIRTDVTGPAIREALEILAATGRAPLPDDELAKAKALVVRALPQDFETNASIAGAFVAVAADGRPLTYFRDLPESIAKVTAGHAGIQAALRWSDLSIVVVGDWAVVGKDLEALGLPITRYDADGNPRK